ncbi:MAG: TonB family protein [Alphaproteobacteria bacterium]|nr:TonB family protein [Alphaproteobacteria bacterium]
MRTSVLSAVAALTVSGAAADTNTSFKMSLQSWQRRCPVIENYEALKARGVYLDAVKARGVSARYDTDPNGGTVMLDVRVDTNGRVKDLQLVNSTSRALVGPVMRAVSEWRYEPIMVDGKEVCVEMRLEVLVSPLPPRSTSSPVSGERQMRSRDYAPPPPPPPPGSPR